MGRRIRGLLKEVAGEAGLFDDVVERSSLDCSMQGHSEFDRHCANLPLQSHMAASPADFGKAMSDQDVADLPA